MPTEFRFLVFTPTEAARALLSFAQTRQMEVPRGAVLKAEPVDGEPPKARLYVRPDQGEDQSLDFETAEVVAALIGDCIKRGVPLPRESEKALEQLHGRLAPRIGMGGKLKDEEE